MISTLAGAYTDTEIINAQGIVMIQDIAMFLINPISNVLSPSLREPESTHPLAILAPTIPIT